MTPHLALADVGGIQDSTLVVFGETPGLPLADPGGFLGPSPFGETPGLPLAVDRVILGTSPAAFGGTPGRVASHAEETQAPWFLLDSTRIPQGPVSPAKPRWGSRKTHALGLPAAGCASPAYPWPSRKISQIRAHVQSLGLPAPSYDVSGRHVCVGQERLSLGRPC